MKLKTVAVKTKHVHLKKDHSIPLSKNAPYDFEDGDTNNFKEFKATPKKPYTHEQVLKAMHALHRMIERQAKNYGGGKLYKAGIVNEGSGEEDETPNPELVQQCYDLMKHLSDNKDETGMQLFMQIVSDIIDFSNDDFSDTDPKTRDDQSSVDDDDSMIKEELTEIPEADAYGGVLIQNGKVLLREPTNHFGGYVWTFAKGRVDPGEDAQTVAIREVFEETGYHAEITHLIPHVFAGSTSSTVFFVMHPVGSPENFGWETQAIKWASYDEAVDLINQTTIRSGRQRDLEILKQAFHGTHVPISEVGGADLHESSSMSPRQHELYSRWRKLVNMTPSQIESFKTSQTKKAKGNASKYPGLKPAEARKQGISSGVQSANWIIKMKNTPVSKWTPEMWRWCGKQVSFISRMKGNAGPLYDADGQPTRKLLSLKIWGHNPSRK